MHRDKGSIPEIQSNHLPQIVLKKHQKPASAGGVVFAPRPLLANRALVLRNNINITWGCIETGENRMAMAECNQCKGAISTEAKVCPHCGAKVAKKVSVFGSILVGVVFSIVLISVIKFTYALLETHQAEQADAVRVGKATHAIKTLKATYRAEDRLQVMVVLTDESAETVCILYRVRNGSGDLRYESVSFYKNEQSKEDVRWQQHCTGPMYDMSSVGRSI